MPDDGRLSRFLKTKARSMGRQYAKALDAYRAGRDVSLPTDEEGRARIVCRRYAERRACAIDDQLRPACYDPDHVDCQGCVEDIRDGRIETW